MIATWMAYATLIGACAAIAAIAAEPLMRARAIALRWVWVAALAASVVVPLGMAVRPVATSHATSLTSTMSRVPVSSTSAPAVPLQLSPDFVLAAVWLAASVVMLLVVVSGIVQLRATRARASREEMAGEPVAVTPDVGPGAVWFGEPRIVLPRWACSLGDESMSLLVRHEREHVRAGDPALLAMALGALIVAPWNLALWYIVRRLRAAIEIDCDARVLNGGEDVRAYGELLLTVAVRRNVRPQFNHSLLALLSFAEPATPLERRIRAMTDRRPALSLSRWIASSAVACVAIVAACEARRPEPVAPVTTFSVDNSQPSKALTSEQSAALKTKLAEEVVMRVPDSALAGDPNKPMLVVYSSTGQLLLAKRLEKDARGGGGVPVNPSAIATVDVAKGEAAQLKSETRGGVIRIVLKPDAEKSPDVWIAPKGKARMSVFSDGKNDQQAKVADEHAAMASTMDESKAAVVPDGQHSRQASPAQMTVVRIFDATGNQVLMRNDGVNPDSLVASDQISRVDVRKPEDNSQAPEIRIYLKPGASFKSR